MSWNEITAWLVGATALVTGVAAFLYAITSAITNAKQALSAITGIIARLDDHSRRITEVGKEVNQVALQIPPNGKNDKCES